MKPTRSANRNGAGEKLISPVTANRSILRSGYFVSPAKRSSRLYSTPVCRSPIQLNMPRTKRLLSRIRAKTSSTRRSTSLKSPTSSGTCTSEIRLNAAVEPRGGRPLEPRVALAHVADRVDDVVPLAPSLGELEHDLGRILQVGVEDDHRVADGEVDAGGERDLVAEVPRQPDEPKPRVGPGRREHQLVGAVAASVVDEDRLGVAVERAHQRARAARELLDRQLPRCTRGLRVSTSAWFCETPPVGASLSPPVRYVAWLSNTGASPFRLESVSDE